MKIPKKVLDWLMCYFFAWGGKNGKDFYPYKGVILLYAIKIFYTMLKMYTRNEIDNYKIQ